MIELKCDRCGKSLANSVRLLPGTVGTLRARVLEGGYLHDTDVDLCEKCTKEFVDWVREKKNDAGDP